MHFDKIEAVKRIPTEPYITFKISLDSYQKVTIATQTGKTLISIALDALSAVGGLKTPVGLICLFLVAFIEKPNFIAFVSEKLFLF